MKIKKKIVKNQLKIAAPQSKNREIE
jgi:hypothetical protein